MAKPHVSAPAVDTPVSDMTYSAAGGTNSGAARFTYDDTKLNRNEALVVLDRLTLAMVQRLSEVSH